MDPIHPIVPGPLPIQRGLQPVDRLERISRERDRPDNERRRRAPEQPPEPEPDENDDGQPHVDVRV